jgi:hypothetical protein
MRPVKEFASYRRVRRLHRPGKHAGLERLWVRFSPANGFTCRARRHGSTLRQPFALYIPRECRRRALSGGLDVRIFSPAAELRPNLLSTGIGDSPNSLMLHRLPYPVALAQSHERTALIKEAQVRGFWGFCP